MYEAAVVAFMCREAGGTAVDETGRPILDIQPQDPHQRTALYAGSRDLVQDIAGCSVNDQSPMTNDRDRNWSLGLETLGLGPLL